MQVVHGESGVRMWDVLGLVKLGEHMRCSMIDLLTIGADVT